MEQLKLENGLKKAQAVLGGGGIAMTGMAFVTKAFAVVTLVLNPALMASVGTGQLTQSSPFFAVGVGLLFLWAACRAFRNGLNTYAGPTG